MSAAKRYAHKIVPHPEEGETKSLDYLVRYHYAQAQAWHLALVDVINDPGPRLDVALSQYMGHARMAFLFDALHLGMSGQEAADWASERNHSESAELVWERAYAHGLNPDEIKAYKIRPYGEKS